jgi:hypothetical protein
MGGAADSNGETMPDYSGKLSEGATPFLENGESILAVLMAAPKGNANAHASAGAGAASTGIVRRMGRRAVHHEMTAAEEAGIRIVAGQMGLVLTQRRLLVLDLGTTRWTRDPEVKELLSEMPLGSIASMEGKRAGLMGALEVTPIAGGRLRLQCQAKPARTFAEAFDRAKAPG